jgi:hypothetical protein
MESTGQSNLSTGPVNRHVGIGLVWTASLIAVLGVIWVCGLAYWRLRIARGILIVKRESKERLPADTPLASQLYDGGSRAIPYLLQEMQESITRNDVTTAIVLYREFLDAEWYAKKRRFPADQRISAYAGMTGTISTDVLRRVHQGAEARWLKDRHEYAPWWKWWDGFHR